MSARVPGRHSIQVQASIRASSSFRKVSSKATEIVVDNTDNRVLNY
jgi:hypothetical protein